VAVPRVVGVTAAEAKERLHSIGLRWTITTQQSDSERASFSRSRRWRERPSKKALP
jgi:hypothetical protein